jgi:hypothetical protein
VLKMLHFDHGYVTRLYVPIYLVGDACTKFVAILLVYVSFLACCSALCLFEAHMLKFVDWIHALPTRGRKVLNSCIQGEFCTKGEKKFIGTHPPTGRLIDPSPSQSVSSAAIYCTPFGLRCCPWLINITWMNLPAGTKNLPGFNHSYCFASFGSRPPSTSSSNRASVIVDGEIPST